MFSALRGFSAPVVLRHDLDEAGRATLLAHDTDPFARWEAGRGLAIDALIRRVEAGGIDEVVLAMNATLEGQTTAHYLAERIERFPVRVTQLAHGLPVGGELDYLDEGTLAQALRARRPVA